MRRFGILRAMRTTIDIPDTLYREVRSKSALEGLTLRSVTITLYTDWLSAERDVEPLPQRSEEPVELPSWAGLCAADVTCHADGPHDMDSIRRSVARARRLGAV